MSAFLAIVMSIIFLFQSVLFTVLRYEGTKNTMNEILEQSAYSVLANFDGHIKDTYGLYMLYQDIGTLETKFKEQLAKNEVNVNKIQLEPKGFSHLSLLETQILEHCQYWIPLESVQEFLERSKSFVSFLKEDVTDLELPKPEEQESFDEEKDYDEDYYAQFDMRSTAKEKINSLWYHTQESVSIPYTEYFSLPSQRLLGYSQSQWQALLNGFGELDLESEEALEQAKACINDLSFENIGSSLYEEYLINEYIVRTFRNSSQEKRDGGYLHYETEYILFGDRVDNQNAQYMQLIILLIRFILNTSFIYQCDDMVAVADIAAYLATIWAYFEGQPTVKNAVLISWSFMESWKDYELLQKGKFIPVYKTEESWKTWLSYKEEATEKLISLCYQDYLRIFLLMVPREVKLARILDVIQLNESGRNSAFQILSSVTSFSVHVVCTYKRKEEWDFTLEGVYGYAKVT